MNVIKILSILLLTAIIVSCQSSDNSTRIEDHKRMAAELASNRLFTPAIDEYKVALSYNGLTSAQRASLNYMIARIYFDELKDYELAAAFYIKAREYDPEGSFKTEASRNLVASLEKLGNFVDAQRQLNSATNLANEKQMPNQTGDITVAKIGDRSIWLSEIDRHITALPTEMQKSLISPEAKRQYVHQYIGVELLYNAAVRENYLSNPEISMQKEQLIKRLVVDRYVVDKVLPPQSGVDTMDVHNYYLANKEKLYSERKYESVRKQVLSDYQNAKAEQAYNEYISKLASSEHVEIYDQRIK